MVESDPSDNARRPDKSKHANKRDTKRIEILGEACVLGITCDISDRNRGERALAQSERMLTVVLDTLPVGVAVVDGGGDILLSNPASRRVWGELITSGRDRYASSKGWWHATGKPVLPGEWARFEGMPLRCCCSSASRC